jgi:hypothetical protein
LLAFDEALRIDPEPSPARKSVSSTTMATAKSRSLGPEYDSGPDACVDAAAVVAGRDLVVACDTFMAHIAGALGPPCSITLREIGEWQ